MEFAKLSTDEINVELFKNFIRHQEVKRCHRKTEGKWTIVLNSFTENWNEENFVQLVSCLKNTCETGGIVMGAFCEGKLKGFFSVESKLFGKNKEYIDLSSLHVSEDMRSKGIGKQLFAFAKSWAKDKGAKKLYLSAHSSVESQAFYKSVGCVEATEYSEFHVEREPWDCQLELTI